MTTGISESAVQDPLGALVEILPDEPSGERTEAERPTSQRRAQGALRWLLRLLSLTVVLVGWQLLVSHRVDLWVRFSKLPAPSDVAAEFNRQLHLGRFYRDLAASMQRILIGFSLATLAGVTAGLAVGRSKVASDLLRPIIEMVRPIPAIAWVPVAILAFPTNEQGIIFITFLAALFPVIVSTQHAVHALPNVWEEAARTMGANRWVVLFRVVLPGVLPGIFAGLSVAMGIGWICVISAEMISGQFGIGYYTWKSYGLINYPGVIVGMLSIGILGLASAAAIETAGRRCTRWLPRNVRRRP